MVNPFFFDGADKRRIAIAQSLAEHKAEVFGEIGLDGDDLARLAADGII
jgi:hypothetical protein